MTFYCIESWIIHNKHTRLNACRKRTNHTNHYSRNRAKSDRWRKSIYCSNGWSLWWSFLSSFIVTTETNRHLSLSGEKRHRFIRFWLLSVDLTAPWFEAYSVIRRIQHSIHLLIMFILQLIKQHSLSWSTYATNNNTSPVWNDTDAGNYL